MGKTPKAQSIIDRLIGNNKQILENNLLCAGLIAKARRNGKSVPQRYIAEIQRLQSNLNRRNERLQNSNFVKTKKASPAGFNRYQSDLNSLSGERIGVAPIVVAIVVTAIISVAATVIAYLIFKPDYSESTQDLKKSKLLTKAIANLTSEEKKEVLNDLEQQVDKAYLQGKMDGTGTGLLTNIAYAGAGLLGLMILGNFND